MRIIIGRFIVSIFLLIFFHGIAVSFWYAVTSMFDNVPWIPLALGTGIGTVVFLIFLRRQDGFTTFEHELTHSITAVLFLRRVEYFVVRPEGGGCVSHVGNFGGWIADDFIRLAPYVFPTFMFIAALIRPFLNSSALPWYDIFIGFTFAFHTLSTIDETLLGWSKKRFRSVLDNRSTVSDLARTGLLFCAVYIPSVTPLYTWIHFYTHWKGI